MPKIMDMQLLQAASMASSHPWDTLQGNFKSAQESFMGNIQARQQADAGLANALSPIFSAASGVLTGGIQNVMGGKSFFNPGTLFNPAQPGGPVSTSMVSGGGGLQAPRLTYNNPQLSAGMEAMRSQMGF